MYWPLLKQRPIHEEINHICRESLTDSSEVELTTPGISSPVKSLFIYQDQGSRQDGIAIYLTCDIKTL